MTEKKQSQTTSILKMIGIGIMSVLMVLMIINISITTSINNQVKDLYKSQIGQLGGTEVLDMLTDNLWGKTAYQKAQVETIQDYLAQMETLLGEDQETNTPPVQGEDKTINTTQLNMLVGGEHLLGNPNGDIMLIVYADFLCSFCGKLHNEGTIQTLVAENQNLSVALKQVALFGEGSLPGAKAAYCVSQLGTTEQYFDLVDAGYDAQVQSADEALALATNIGISEKDFTDCYNDNATTDAVNTIYAEGVSNFGINGTPATIVINKITGKYQVIGGALPKVSFETAIFETAIQELL